MERSVRTSVHENRQKTNAKILQIPTSLIGRLRKTIPPESIRLAFTALSAPHDAPPWDIGLFGSKQSSPGDVAVSNTSTTCLPWDFLRRKRNQMAGKREGRAGSLQKHPFSPARTDGRIHYSPCQIAHATKIQMLFPTIPTG
jgi:hypothetical protein